MKIEEKELEISFEEFEINMLTIKENNEGVVLIDSEDNENYFIKDKLKQIFGIINKKTVEKISYINNDFNKIKINEFYITLLNNKKYTVELL